MIDDIRKKLRKIRREQEISQDSVAAIMGKNTVGYVSLLESGKRNPTLGTLTSWADALGYRLTLEPKE
jgi:transcriptional regulator with XRE-family HTH domain